MEELILNSPSTTSLPTPLSALSLNSATLRFLAPFAASLLRPAIMRAIRLFSGLVTSRAMLMQVCIYLCLSSRLFTDTSVGVMEDAKFKRREALADLAKAVAKK